MRPNSTANHDLKATYNGANNGWKLTAGSSVRVTNAFCVGRFFGGIFLDL